MSDTLLIGLILFTWLEDDWKVDLLGCTFKRR
jgi:hypothetical protein